MSRREGSNITCQQLGITFTSLGSNKLIDLFSVSRCFCCRQGKAERQVVFSESKSVRAHAEVNEQLPVYRKRVANLPFISKSEAAAADACNTSGPQRLTTPLFLCVCVCVFVCVGSTATEGKCPLSFISGVIAQRRWQRAQHLLSYL